MAQTPARAIVDTSPAVTWWQTPDGVHAFPDEAGFTRSVCKRERWTVKVVAPADDAEHCPDCSLLVDGAPGEITESYGR